MENSAFWWMIASVAGRKLLFTCFFAELQTALMTEEVGHSKKMKTSYFYPLKSYPLKQPFFSFSPTSARFQSESQSDRA
jgi:hypothetical protein